MYITDYIFHTYWCCAFTLRTGCQIIGWVTIALSISEIIFVFFLYKDDTKYWWMVIYTIHVILSALITSPQNLKYFKSYQVRYLKLRNVLNIYFIIVLISYMMQVRKEKEEEEEMRSEDSLY
ncbi:hypothetical protein ILUMI_24732 [Ignelater luminosus]|uniref:Transmembrane protein n=1 Tax=Ignelater luminosus TaxID=2038154 RepID=A0A8K0G0D0_IGNLU|nr:hypothetical protein ILUMI_24732 [Ignelater luminosus]